MTHEQARQYMREHATDILQPDGKGTGFICPVCNSGGGKHGTGIKQTSDNLHFTCFANDCYSNADIIDILAVKDGLGINAGYMDKFNNAVRYFNIPVDDQNEYKKPTPTRKEAEKMNQEQSKTDYTEYYKRCNADVKKTEYWKTRGIADDTIKRFMLGYDEQHNAIVIPIDKYTYKTRRTDRKQFYNSKGGTMKLYNTKALNNAVVYVCESEIDALSIEQLGKPAIAIRGTSNTELVKEYIENNETPTETLLLCLDNDEPGTKATEKIIESFYNTGINCIDIRPLFAVYTVTDEDGTEKNINDINELLVTDQDKLQGITDLTVDLIKEAVTALLRKQYIDQNSTTAYINEFLNGVSESVNTPPIPTGFTNLDEYLTGGLREGLYAVGAVTSLGKTTFMLQIADYIATQGTDVILFALEMNKTEIMAKSFSRNTYTYCLKNNIKINPFAKSNLSITDGTKYDTYSEEEKQIIKQAIKDYSKYSDHIFIYENHPGIAMSIMDIERITEKHIKNTGHRPVIILDYLQLLAPPQERLTDKQAVDQSIVRLKAISNTYKTPVIVISSFNRENYDIPVNFKAFKESGNIEYTCNAVIGLQLKGVGKKEFSTNTAMQKNPRNIELLILKNRHGQTGGTLYFNYYPQFSYFENATEGAND